MKHANGWRRPLAGMLAALLGATLACTLNFGGEAPGASSANNVPDGPAPTVRVIQPPSGTRIPANQPLDITVATDATTTSFLMSVGGRVTTTKALPPGQSGPTQAILTWTPNREGTYTIEIVAFNGSAASLPAALIVEVTAAAGGSGSGSGAGCTGRVTVQSLNFRSAAGTQASRLGQFELGETVTVIGRNADTSWWQVQRASGQQVWVINNAQWLQVTGTCDAIPVTG